MKEGITGKEVEITGIDGDFKSSLTAYHDFKEKINKFVTEPGGKRMHTS